MVLTEGLELTGLRRFKDDVTEVREGFECGINLGSFNDVQEGDLIATVVPPRVGRVIGTFARLVVLAVSAFMAVAGIMMVDIVAAIAMPASGLPTALLYLAATVGFILIFIGVVVQVLWAAGERAVW